MFPRGLPLCKYDFICLFTLKTRDKVYPSIKFLALDIFDRYISSISHLDKIDPYASIDVCLYIAISIRSVKRLKLRGLYKGWKKCGISYLTGKDKDMSKKEAFRKHYIKILSRILYYTRYNNLPLYTMYDQYINTYGSPVYRSMEYETMIQIMTIFFSCDEYYKYSKEDGLMGIHSIQQYIHKKLDTFPDTTVCKDILCKFYYSADSSKYWDHKNSMKTMLSSHTPSLYKPVKWINIISHSDIYNEMSNFCVDIQKIKSIEDVLRFTPEHIPSGGHSKLKIVSMKNCEKEYVLKSCKSSRIGCIRELLIYQNINTMIPPIYNIYITPYKNTFYERISFLIKKYDEDLFSYRVEKNHIEQICKVLKILHDKNIVHGDIKPTNMAIDIKSQQCTLIDFGLSYIDNVERWDESRGTPGYQAPELCITYKEGFQWTNGKKRDIWALGISIYEMMIDENIYEKHLKKNPLDTKTPLDLVLETFGYPDESFWSDHMIKPSNYIPKKETIWDMCVRPDINPLLIDLLKNILTIDPLLRYNIDDILKHSFFK